MNNPTQNVDAQALFGRNMKALRKSKELTQENLAELSGLHVNYISGVERGLRNISIVNIEKIARALGVSMSVLVDESSERHDA